MPPKKKQKTSSTKSAAKKPKTRASTTASTAASVAAATTGATSTGTTTGTKTTPLTTPTVVFNVVPTLNNIAQWGLNPGDMIPGCMYPLDQMNCDFFQTLVLFCGVHPEMGKELIRHGVENAEEFIVLDSEQLKILFKTIRTSPTAYLPKAFFLNITSQRKIIHFHRWCYEREVCYIQQNPLLYNEDEQEWIKNQMKEITMLKSKDEPPEPPS